MDLFSIVLPLLLLQ